jgi:hypothetical protein
MRFAAIPSRALTSVARIAGPIRKGCIMTLDLWLGAIVAGIVLVYLLAVLAQPEKF